MWWVAAALAFEVEVLPDPAPPARERMPVAPAGPLTLGEGPVVVDGRLDEAAWATPRTPLLPLVAGPAPPDVGLRVAVSPEGVALALDGLPQVYTSALALDPDGASQRWWRLVAGPDGVVVERCTLEGEEATEGWYIPGGAVPCHPAEGVTLVRAGGVLEALVPWAALPTASTRARVAWAVTGPRGAGGTLALTGAAHALPAQGRLLPLAGPGAALDVVSDADQGAWRGRLVVRRPTGLGVWTWTRYAGGAPIDSGSLSVERVGELRWDMPDLTRQDVLVDLRPPEGRVGLSDVVGRRRYEVKLGTPVGDGRVELAWETPDPAVWRITVGGEGSADVELPAGAGRIVLRLEGSGAVPVRVEDLLSAPGGPRSLLDVVTIVRRG